MSGTGGSRQRFERSRDHDLQVPFRENWIGVFPIENFALLRDAYFAGEISGRLRKDGSVGWTPSAANGSTSSMEQPELHVVVAGGLMQCTVRFVEFPHTGEHTAILVGIGVAEHHFLPT